MIVPIRTAHFLACCNNAQELSSSTEDDLIESVLSALPSYALEAMGHIEEPKEPNSSEELDDSESIEDYARYDELSDLDIDDYLVQAKEEETESKTPPSYLPYKNEQWRVALNKLKRFRGPQNLRNLFVFDEPKTEPREMPEFIKDLDESPSQCNAMFLLDVSLAPAKFANINIIILICLFTDCLLA